MLSRYQQNANNLRKAGRIVKVYQDLTKNSGKHAQKVVARSKGKTMLIDDITLTSNT